MIVYSWNGEDHWTEDLEEVETEILDNEGPGVYTISTGFAVKPEIDKFVFADDLIDQITNNLWSVYDEYCEDFCLKIEQNTEQLQYDLAIAIKEHMKRQKCDINFFTVVDIKEIEIDVKDD